MALVGEFRNTIGYWLMQAYIEKGFF